MSRTVPPLPVWLLPRMDSEERRERARLLDALLVVFIPTFVGVAVYIRFVIGPSLDWLNPEFVLLYSLIVVVAGAFFLNRKGHYLAAAVPLVLAVLAGVFLANHFTVSGQMEPTFSPNDVGLLSYLVVPMVLAAALLPARLFAGVVVVCMVGSLLVSVWYPHIALMQIVRGPLQFLVIIMVLLTSITHYLTRQERERMVHLGVSERRFSSLFEQSLDPIVISDADGRVREMNESATRLFGYGVEDFASGSVTNLFANEADAVALADRMREEGLLYEMPVKLRTRDDVILECLVTSLARRDSSGGIVEYQMVARDVTEALRAQEERRLRGNLLELAFDPVLLVDPGGEIVYANQALSDLTGYSQQELTGLNIRRLNLPDGVDRVPTRIGELLRGGSLDFEATWVSKSADRIFVEVRARTIRNQGRTLFLSVARDVTRRKKDEAELRLRGALLDLSSDAVLLHDLKGRLLYVNEAAVQRYGSSREEVLSMSLKDLTSPQDYAQFHDRLGKLLSGRSLSFESNERSRDGYLVPVEVNARLIEMDGQPLVLSVARDITDRKRAEEELLKTEQRYRELFEQSMDAVAVFSEDGVLLDANPAHMRLFGNTIADIGQRVVLRSYVNPSDRDEFICMLKRDGVVLDQEVRLKKRDGAEMDCIRTAVATRDESGGILSIQTVTRDITERKRAERELRDREEKYRELFRQSMDAISLVSVDGTLLDANRACLELYGWSAEDIGRVNVQALYVDPSRRADFLRRLDAAGSIANEEVVQQRADGTRFVCFVSAVARRDPMGRMVALQALVRDITEWKCAQQELRESESRFRSLVENTGAGILVSRLDGRILDCNEAVQKMLGHTREEMLAVTVPDLYADGNDREEVVAQFRRDGFLRAREIEFVHKDGHPVYVALTSAYAPFGGESVVMSELLDVTERRQAENELRESRERLQMLTMYLEDARERERAGIARELHDQLGQALTALRLDLESLIGKQERGETISRNNFENLAQLVDETVADVRRISSELRPGILDDIGLLAAIEWQLGQWSARTGIAYNAHFEAGDADLDRARSTALFRVLQELLTNVARHSGATTLDVSFAHPKGRVVLMVSDNGCGITEEQAGDPGSLGLVGMRERLRPLGGDLGISGSPGCGTTARASLPVS